MGLYKWKIMARHKWVSDCTITESHCDFKSGELAYIRFTATINGWRNFKIYEGYAFENEAVAIGARVRRLSINVNPKLFPTTSA